jgi:putative transposase
LENGREDARPIEALSSTYPQTPKRRERERRLAAERKRSHGELANRILGQGTTVKTEKLSYNAWQRQRYGKSLVRMLERKAATGGELIAFATRNTCLSQFSHVDRTSRKSR